MPFGAAEISRAYWWIRAYWIRSIFYDMKFFDFFPINYVCYWCSRLDIWEIVVLFDNWLGG